MSDDEFGLDDTFLDAATLAALDAAEQRHVQSGDATQPAPCKPLSQIPSKPSQERFIRPPPPKRVRGNDWTVTTKPNRDVNDSDDDIPDMAIVAHGGKYRIIDPIEGNPRSASFAAKPGKQLVNPSQSVTNISQRVIRPVPSSQVIRGNGIARPASQRPPMDNSMQASQARYAAITAALKDTRINESDEELAQLRAQLAQLRRDHEAALVSAKAAETARLTRDGEVFTLRRTMAKMEELNNEKVSKLQAEKTAEEEKRKQLEHRMNQERERMRTNLELRRQELETSTRKTPWSRQKPRPAHGNNRAAVFETPIRSVPHLEMPTSGGNFQPPNARLDIERSKRPASKRALKFPGFVDSFRSSSPVKKRPTLTDDVTAKQEEHDHRPLTRPNMEEYFSPIDIEPPTSILSRSRESSRPEGVSFTDESQEMDLGQFDGGEESQMNSDLVIGESMDEGAVNDQPLHPGKAEQDEEMDWANACFRLLFTHTSSPSCQLTLQMLLSTSIPHDRLDKRDEYTESCSLLLEAAASRSSDLAILLRPILEALLKIGQILVDVAAVDPLSALFDLLATICIFLPSSSTLLLSNPSTEGGELLSLSIIAQTLRSYSSPKGVNHSPQVVDQAIRLIEALCLMSSKDEISRIASVVLQHTILSSLLDSEQPRSTMHGIIRCLSIITIYPECTASFLSFPNDAPNRRDLTRIPQVEKLAYTLAEPIGKHLRHEAIQIRHSIMRCFTQVAFSSSESATKLAQCQAVLPALISTLCSCTTAIWDSLEDEMENILLIGHLQIISGILQLLHYMIFRPEVNADIQRVLQSPLPKFSGLEHMFVIALGRLSYAEPPDWNDPECATLGESVAEMARDILEDVVSGPEVDTIWASYQDAREGSDTEEDEMSDAQIDGTDGEDMMTMGDM
ncbi:hypothetical protein FRB91_003543 [Serendipita sp. 411]|nr:hypothetical protein FRB91_003543 [Serendipita sp. 411]